MNAFCLRIRIFVTMVIEMRVLMQPAKCRRNRNLRHQAGPHVACESAPDRRLLMRYQPKAHFFIVALVALGLLACEPVDFKKVGDASADSSASADASSARDSGTPPSAPNSCLNRCGNFSETAKCQCDSECVSHNDCCGDYAKCLASNPAADAGSSQPAADVVQPVTKKVDNDGDGFYDSTPQPGDCNDNDPNVHPGATEICDGKDNNCTDGIDEGCPAATGSNFVTITYSSAFQRTLNVQVTSNKADLGKWWDPGSVSSNGTSLTKYLDKVTPSTCEYILWNVVDSDPSVSYSTACVGNGGSADMNKNAVPNGSFIGKTFSKADLITWSNPKGTQYGCAGLFIIPGPGGTTASCAL